MFVSRFGIRILDLLSISFFGGFKFKITYYLLGCNVLGKSY